MINENFFQVKKNIETVRILILHIYCVLCNAETSKVLNTSPHPWLLKLKLNSIKSIY